MKRVGIFGGSFNPIHNGHLVMAEQAREALDLDCVLFVPAKVPPHKQDVRLAPARHRLQMVRLAIAGNPGFGVSAMELRRTGPSYTIDTVRSLRRRFGSGTQLYFLIGADTVAELPTWREIGTLVQMCTFVAFARPGVRLPPARALARSLGADEARRILREVIAMPLIGISASDVRRRAAEGRSIRYLVPDAVADYIAQKGLYRSRRLAPWPRRRCS